MEQSLAAADVNLMSDAPSFAWMLVCIFMLPSFRLRCMSSNSVSGLRVLASDKVLRLDIVPMPSWASLGASGNMESVISRNESNLLMTA